MPDFIALSADADTAEAAKTIAQVLWDDLAFEREFDMIPRDTYASIPAARSMTGVPFDRWRELGADGLLIGTVQRQGDALRVEVTLFSVEDQAVGVLEGIHRVRRQPAVLRAHDRRRDSTRRSWRCAAWPARRSRSSPTATASG